VLIVGYINYEQSNLAPVEEIGAPVAVADIQGTLPQQFPQGIFLRNGKFFTL